IGMIVIVAAVILIQESYDTSASRKMDWGGILTLSAGMFSLTLGLIQANDEGWTSMYILTLFLVSLVAFIAFVWIEFKSKEPMLPLWMLKIWPFTAGSVTLLIVGFGLMCEAFLMVFFLTQVHGYSEVK